MTSTPAIPEVPVSDDDLDTSIPEAHTEVTESEDDDHGSDIIPITINGNSRIGNVCANSVISEEEAITNDRSEDEILSGNKPLIDEVIANKSIDISADLDAQNKTESNVLQEELAQPEVGAGLISHDSSSNTPVSCPTPTTSDNSTEIPIPTTGAQNNSPSEIPENEIPKTITTEPQLTGSDVGPGYQFSAGIQCYHRTQQNETITSNTTDNTNSQLQNYADNSYYTQNYQQNNAVPASRYLPETVYTQDSPDAKDLHSEYRGTSNLIKPEPGDGNHASQSQSGSVWSVYMPSSSASTNEYANYPPFTDFNRQYNDLSAAPVYTDTSRISTDPMLPRPSDIDDISAFQAQQFTAAAYGAAPPYPNTLSKYDGQTMEQGLQKGNQQPEGMEPTAESSIKKQKKVVVPAGRYRHVIRHV